jgi:hypothetical protein
MSALNTKLLVAAVVLLAVVFVAVVGTATVACVLIVPNYNQLVKMIQQSELVMCCISNLCESPLVNVRKCPVPPALKPAQDQDQNYNTA